VETFTDPVIENSRFRIQADEHGLVSIFDKTLGREIATRGEYRPGELILEHDEGSPWATLCSDQRRAPLALYTRFIGTEMSAGCQRLLFDVDVPREFGFSGNCLRARISVTLVEGLDRVDFKMEADWAAYNHRLRIAMPVPAEGLNKHIYEIPYGMIERKPYEPWFRWAGANGDWPAINWAGVEQPGLSVALLNKGTPSYRIENGTENTEVILLSVLRSPAIPTYLHEPEFYSMTDFDGMRDEGKHAIEFALTAYHCPFHESGIVLDAESYNTAPVVIAGAANLPAMPVFVSDSARISAVKWAEQGNGLVLRVVEFRGQGGESAIRLPDSIHTAEKTNLLERQAQTLPVQHGIVRFDLRPWEIATIKLGV
jgi:alpha-mannosidase